MGPGGLVPPCRAAVALSSQGSPSSERAESALQKPSRAASQAGESPSSPGFGSAFSTFPPSNAWCTCLFFAGPSALAMVKEQR